MIRYNPMGTICAENISPVDYVVNGQFDESGRTYADDAALLASLASIGFVLMCCQCTFCCVPLLLTPVKEG